MKSSILRPTFLRSLAKPGPRVSTLVMCLAVSIFFVSPAEGQHCTDSTVPGTLIGFTPLPGVIEKPNSCNLLPCYKPEEDGGAYLATDEDCDALSGSCPVQMRVPLKFPGNSQMPNNGHVRVYWFDQATPDETACLPPPLGSCLPISICGPLGAEILVDRGETWIQVGASCESIASGEYAGGSFSLSAYACQTFSGECTERLDVPGLELPSPEEAWELLGCGPPPPRNCDDCTACPVGGTSVGTGPPEVAPAGLGPVPLRYKGRAAGHPDFPGTASWNLTLGRYWVHEFAERIVSDPDDTHVWLITRFAAFHEFENLVGGVYQKVSPSSEYRKLHRTVAGWELHDLDGTVQHFDNAGLWTRTEDRNGNAVVASYIGSSLNSVSFPDGRSVTFAYRPDGRLASVTEVGVGGAVSRTWSYTWSGLDLMRIDRPDGTAWSFLYDDPRHPGSMTRMTLVGTDGNERIERAWKYDGRSNVVRTWKGAASFSSADAVDQHRFVYDNPFRPTLTQVIDPLGNVTTYEIGRDPAGVKPRITKISGGCSICGLGPNTQQFYDDPANPMRVTRSIDAQRTVTLFEYDEHGQMISRTEAFMTDLERTTTWEYNKTYHSLVTAIEQPSVSGSGVRRTSWIYDGSGNAVTRIEEGVENGEAFRYETVTVYNEAGQPEIIDPPGYGTDDIKVISYDPARGDLIPISWRLPLLGTVAVELDPLNREVQTTDINGLVTERDFDPLDRLQHEVRRGQSSSEDLVMILSYTPFGDLHRVQLPLGNVIEYGYDNAGRLISSERRPDATTRGEREVYTLDALGNRQREEFQRWDGSNGWDVEWFLSYDYGSSCRLEKITHSDGTTQEFGYDCDGNLDREWDELHPSEGGKNPPSLSREFDELGRLISIRAPWGGAGGGFVTQRFEYDAQDNPHKIVDSHGGETVYVYSDRGLLTEESSVATGTSKHTYNEHGRLIQTLDARQNLITRQVDAADRLRYLDLPGDSLDSRYFYEDPLIAFSRGTLTAIERDGYRVEFRFDRFGRMIQDGMLGMSYDKNDNIVRLDYPGGVAVQYSYDFADRPLSATLDEGAQATLLAKGAEYLPSGPLEYLELGNGLSEMRTFSNRYFPETFEVPGHLQWSYSTNTQGDITAITDVLDATRSRSYDYQDYQYYLTSAIGPWGSRSWIYDQIGNRSSENSNATAAQYHYETLMNGESSPRLRQVDGGSLIHYAFDAAGHVQYESQDGRKIRYSYDSTERLSEIRVDESTRRSSLVRFQYDGRGFLRQSTLIRDLIDGTRRWETRPTYSSEGRLMHRNFQRFPDSQSPRGELSVAGDDYVLYFADRPIALLSRHVATDVQQQSTDSRRLLYLSTDVLDTPVLATDEEGATVWSGGFGPFGRDDLDAESQGIFLRFDGQWCDETWSQVGFDFTLLYNVYRWYRPDLGRYMRFEPLRLLPEHHYQYVLNRPTRFVDPRGLNPNGRIPSGAVLCGSTENNMRRDSISLPDCCKEESGDPVTQRQNLADRLEDFFCANVGMPPARPTPRDPSRVFVQIGGIDRDRYGVKRSWILPTPSDNGCTKFCRCAHELQHLRQESRGPTTEQNYNERECSAWGVENRCLSRF